MKWFATVALCVLAWHGAAQNYPQQNDGRPTDVRWKNANLSALERAKDLCSRLTLEEKAQLMMDESPAIPRLGIRKFYWWSEALHGAANMGNVTVFPEPVAMAASFNPGLLYKCFDVASTEFRAQYNHRMHDRKGEDEKFHSLSVWTPNVNIFRDPRWGRGQETYGEDPYLTSVMGLQVVRGLQGPEDAKYRKLWACAKHYAVHSGPEYTRHSANLTDVSPRDVWETYLPAFKTLVLDGKVREVMCAYQRLDDDPCCGSNRLLQTILRDEWGFRYLVVSDCGAVSDFYTSHKSSTDSIHASAKAVLAGTDVECGFAYAYKGIPEAVRRGLMTEAEVDKHVVRLLEGRFDLGEMDDPSLVEWSKIPYSAMSTKASADVSLDMARQTIVLLKNRPVPSKGGTLEPILPLQKNRERIAVIGPNADNAPMMWGNYNGMPNHTVTILDGTGQFELYIDGVRQFRHHIWRMTPNRVPIQAEKGKSYQIEVRFAHVPTYNADLKINVAKEMPIDYQQTIAQLKGIDKVVFVGGISPALEGEEMPVDIEGFKGGDRTSIELPKVQREFLKALKAAGKQVVFVNCSGSCIALQPEMESCDAIVQAWYAGQEGGTAVADVLFGDVNPGGKLPVTFYKSDKQLPDYEDYSMKGRTYRYFSDALFPFGYGLSYTSFEIRNEKLEMSSGGSGRVTVEVANTGKRDGSETVQLYIRNLQDPDGPLKSLRAFQRVNVKAGQTTTVTLSLDRKSFEFWDPETNTMRVKPGRYDILVGNSSADKDLRRLSLSL